MSNYFFYDVDLNYPSQPPYNPPSVYSEYPFHYCLENVTEDNKVYSAIRKIFFDCELDKNNAYSSKWNPLKRYIHEGQTVLIKPNLVNHFNPNEKDRTRGLDCLITHPSVVRCLFDYVYIALQGKGTIIIADAPIQGCEFDKLLVDTGYGELFKWMESKATSDLKIFTADLRETVYMKHKDKILQAERENQYFKGKIIDLKDNSYFSDVKCKKRLRVTCYDGKDTISHHNKNHNEYKVSDALLQADVVINIPKPKTHRIAGYTGALKNMIGINTRKEFLPHHQKGAEKNKADEYTDSFTWLKWFNSTANDKRNHAIKMHYDRLEKIYNNIGRITGRKLDKLEPNRYRNGMWYGNDTIWRTILDVNYIVNYADKNGKIQHEPQRKIIHIGDMVISGDYEGPLNPSYKRVGGLLFSDNAIEFDYCLVKLMGFDWKKFKVLMNALKDTRLFHSDREEIILKSNDERYSKIVDEIVDDFSFAATSGWKEYLKKGNIKDE